MSADIIATIAGGVAYAASIITHLGILKYFSKGSTTVSLETDLEGFLNKIRGLDNDAVEAATKVASNPTLKPVITSLATAAESELPPEVTTLISDVVNAAVKFAKTPATTASTPPPAAATVSASPVVPVAAPAAAPAEVPEKDTATAEAPTVQDDVPARTPVQSSAAKLMGLPQ